MSSAAKKGLFGFSTAFYTQLVGKVIAFCEEGKRRNGGLTSIAEIVAVNNSKAQNDKISRDDVIACLRQAEVFGRGIRLIGADYVSCSPFLLPESTNVFLEVHKAEGRVNFKALQRRGWTVERFEELAVR